MRVLAILPVLALVLLDAGIVSADAVDPCPPGFRPSHSGCRVWNPAVEAPEEMEYAACCCCAGALVLAGAALALGVTVRRARGSREG